MTNLFREEEFPVRLLVGRAMKVGCRIREVKRSRLGIELQRRCLTDVGKKFRAVPPQPFYDAAITRNPHCGSGLT